MLLVFNMHSDSFFFMGKLHNVCQDYTRHGNSGDMTYALLSDGCSSSPDTDLGARLLCFAAEANINHLFKSIEEVDYTFCSHTIDQAYNMLSPNINPYCLDATLLAVTANKEDTIVQVVGDGVVATIDNNDSIHVYETIYTSSAPRYLNYWVHNNRHEAYIKEFGTSVVLNDYNLETPNANKLESVNDLQVRTIRLKTEEYKAVILMSDGVSAFNKKVLTDSGAMIDGVTTSEVLNELLAYKNYTGEFIKKRTKRFEKNLNKKLWENLDDVSVAGVYLK